MVRDMRIALESTHRGSRGNTFHLGGTLGFGNCYWRVCRDHADLQERMTLSFSMQENIVFQTMAVRYEGRMKPRAQVRCLSGVPLHTSYSVRR